MNLNKQRVNPNPVISVVMSAYNVEKYIREAIDSIVNQSFADFECIIVDDGSTDKTKEIIRSYDDKRIILVENKHDFIESLNMGMKRAKGKYIARMDADDIMHPDRLKIQHSIMETERSIAVCGTWMNIFGENISKRAFGIGNGLIEHPLLMFLKRCFIANPSTMIRSDFLRKHRIQYEKEYIYTEDFKFWVEVAKHRGVFYVESQPLVNYRISENQVTKRKREEQKTTSERISREILNYLLERNKEKHSELADFLQSLLKLHESDFISFTEMLQIAHRILHTNKNRLSLA